MNNIKTIEVVKPVFGLNVGDRLNKDLTDGNFYLAEGCNGEGYSFTRVVSVKSDSVDKENFKVVEWIEPKPLTNRQRIEQLEGQLKDAEENMELGQKNYTAILKENEEMLALLTKIDKRIQYKRDEYSKKVQELDKELADKLLCGERIEWADEALTVYANMLELLDKIVE